MPEYPFLTHTGGTSVVVPGLTLLAMLATGTELVAFTRLSPACDRVGTN